MLRWRLLLGTLLIAALVGLCWLDYNASRPGLWLFGLALVVALLAAQETVELMVHAQLRPAGWIAMLGTVLVVAACGVPLFWPDYPPDCPLGTFGWPVVALALGLLLGCLGAMHRYDGPSGAIANLAATMFPMLYVGLLLCFAVQLRLVGGNQMGMVALGSMIVVVKLGDIGAYTVGRLVGRHKMAPVLSPGKTWEGAAGAVAFACLGSYVSLEVLLPALVPAGTVKPWAGGWLVYGVALAISGIVGDLAESLLKRGAGCKDSSAWLPGFGGVLDLLDSILASTPVAYLFWIAQ